MKIFTSEQIRDIDRYTIKYEPIESIDLMERASLSLFLWFTNNIDKSTEILVFAGPGNNGGDGLALARMLHNERYQVKVFYVEITNNTSPDWKINMKRLQEFDVAISTVKSVEDLPVVEYDSVIVDAIFGSGLKRNADGLAAEVIKELNSFSVKRISVDMPSGLFGEDNSKNDYSSVFKADITLTLEFPKLSFMLSENSEFVGDFYVLPIGLHKRAIREKDTPYQRLDLKVASSILKSTSRFDHKGTNGHGLLVSGSCGKYGAAVLASNAALRTGIGLLTVHIPKPAAELIHNSVPEAMVQCDQSEILISEVNNADNFDAVGVGPGIGTKPNTIKALKELISSYKGPMVIDADGLNILSQNQELISELSEQVILTPHPGEFDRIAGKSATGYERIQKQLKLSLKTGSIIVLKGAFTSISLPDGRLWFNSSGNPGMATAGSGDVLTGMILALLAKRYCPADAALAGVFLHGLAGDIYLEKSAPESLIASDIINNIGQSYNRIRKG